MTGWRFLAAVYDGLMRLYPADFRARFAEEMRLTFADALDDAAGRGFLAVLVLLLREAHGLSAGLLAQHLDVARRGKIGAPALPFCNLAAQQRFDAPASWLAAIIGAAAFLIPALRWSLVETPLAQILSRPVFADAASRAWIFGMHAPAWLPYVQVAGLLYFGLTFLPALVFGIAWLHGFPRWSYPYTALMALYGVTLMDSNSWGYLHWGWRAWLPALIAVGVGMLATRSLRPPADVIANARRDWTLITWSLFTLFACFILIGLDDPRSGTDQWRAPLQTYTVLTLAAMGLALAYLRCASIRRRAGALLAGIAGTFALAVVAPILAGGAGAVNPIGLVMLPVVLAILFSPGLFAARRRRT